MATRCRRLLLGSALAALASVTPSRASAQQLYANIDAETTVSSVRFEVQDAPLLATRSLRDRIATEGPGALAGVQSFFSWLPLVNRPQPPRFDPVTLQRDVVRLRRHYRQSGYPRAAVDYTLRHDPVANSVEVILEIVPGVPTTVGSVRLVGPLPADTGILEMGSLELRLTRAVGSRLGSDQVDGLATAARGWVTERGYPFPRIDVVVEEEGDTLAPGVLVNLDPGRRATVGNIRVEGAERLGEETVRRQLLLEPGAAYSSHLVDESAENLVNLDLVQLALVEPESSPAFDSAVDLRIQVLEGTPRLIRGKLGYSDAQGVLSEVSWAHRDLLGGGRTLDLALTAETGLWSLDASPLRRYGGSASLSTPAIFGPRTSWITRVFAENADGPRELARSLGADGTVLYRRGSERLLSIQYEVALKDIVEFRGGGLGTLGFLEVLRFAQESVEGTALKTALTVSASWGARDDINPTQGWTVRGAAVLGGVDPWSDSQYARLDGSALVLRELWGGGPRVLLQGRAGRVVPFGRSGPGADPLQTYLRLSDAVFTEGGTRGVRGWDTDLLGPKVPELDFVVEGDSVGIIPRARYAALGGLARLAGSAELQLPLPVGSGRHYALLFADGGRVWTPDDRFLAEDGLPVLAIDEDPGYSVGGGLSMATSLGPIRLMVGYKLNPTELDLRNPLAVGQEVLTGDGDIENVPVVPGRRWRFHLGIGQVF